MSHTGSVEMSIINYLQYVDFPRSRQELIDYCQQLNAPRHVIAFIKCMPDRQYNSWQDFMSAVSETDKNVWY